MSTANAYTTRADLFCARAEGRRLASARRHVGTGLVVLGVPLAVLHRCDAPTVRGILVTVAFVWLCLVPVIIRLLVLEMRNERVVEQLQALSQQ